MRLEVEMVALFCTVLGAVLAYFAFLKGRDKDTKKDAEDNAIIRTKLDIISNGVDNIRVDMKAMEKGQAELREHQIRIDESVKQAHIRIDKLEDKIDERL